MNIGILGGGQLGLMLGQAGIKLGHSFTFIDPDPAAPAAKIGNHICANYDDLAALEQFAEAGRLTRPESSAEAPVPGCPESEASFIVHRSSFDVVTYEFENVPVSAVEYFEKTCHVLPDKLALLTAQDRVREKRLFQKLEIPTPDFLAATGRAEAETAINQIGLPAVIKTTRMGYDGKGQAVIRDFADLSKLDDAFFAVPLIIEQFIKFERELSILTVRAENGEQRFYPLVENVHRNGILRQTTAPAPRLTAALTAQARDIALRIAAELNYVGTLCVELFEKNGVLMANEIAPRVHNSGHWSIESAETSQFENHIRAITGALLGSCELRGHSVMINAIGKRPDQSALAKLPNTYTHLYGKAERPNRKIGHITICGDTLTEIEPLLKSPVIQSVLTTDVP